MRGQPGDLGAVLEHLAAQAGVAAAVADVPLPGGHDLERLVAALVEVRHAGGGRRLTVEVAALAEQRDHLLAGGEDRLAGEPPVGRGGVGGGEPLRRLAGEPAVAADDGAHRQRQLAPPLHVGEVAERAAHDQAGALVHLGGRVRHHGDLDAEDRRRGRGAEELLVALVVGVRDERDGRRDQLGAGGLHVQRRAVRGVVGHPMVGTRVLAGLDLGLGDGGAVGDVPDRRRLGEVGLAAGEVAQERALADLPRLAPGGGVGLRPVDREAEGAPEVLEDLLVLLDELLAQLDEVGPADRHLLLRVGLLRRREVVVVGERRVAPDAVVVLHPALGGQAVVVPAHRVEDRLSGHPLVAGDQVGVGVGEHVTDVQVAAHRGGRGVDRVHVLARLGAVEGVGLVLRQTSPHFSSSPSRAGLSGTSSATVSSPVVSWPWFSIVVMVQMLGGEGPSCRFGIGPHQTRTGLTTFPASTCSTAAPISAKG